MAKDEPGAARPRLKIIVVSTEPPDPFGNAAGRWLYVLARGLSARGHSVRWLAGYSNRASAERAQSCLAECRTLQMSFFPHRAPDGLAGTLRTLRRPYSYVVSDDLRKAFDTEKREGYDVLHLEDTWAGWLAMGVPRALLSIYWLASVDFGGVTPATPRLWATGVLMKRTERRIISGFGTIRTLSARDQRVVQRFNPGADVTAIPLALDPRLYGFSSKQPEIRCVGLLGNMNWLPTYSASVRLIERVWPRVKAKLPGATLLVGGWGARHALQRYLDDPDISVVENFPDAEPYFRRLSALVLPLSVGSGTNVKVLEAMAYGIPVVTTSEGVQGIPVVPGVHAAVADDDDGLAERTTELVADPGLCHSISLAARRLVEEHHGPERALDEVERLYRKVLDSDRAGSP